MKFRLLFSFALLIVVIYIASRTVNINDLKQVVITYPLGQLLVLCFISLIISTLKAWRFAILLRNSQIKVSFWDSFKTFVAGQATTPLPGGEVLRSLLIRHETGTKLIKTTGPVVMQGFLDLIAAALFALIGSLVYEEVRIPVIICLSAIIAFTLAILHPRFIHNLLAKLPKSKFFNKAQMALTIFQANIRENLIDKDRSLPDKTFIASLLLSFLTCIFGGIMIWLIAYNLHQDLDLFKSTFVFSAGALIQGLASISPGGFGFTEGGMVGILLLSNMSLPNALGLVVIFRATSLLFSILVGLIFLLAFYSKTFVVSTIKS